VLLLRVELDNELLSNLGVDLLAKRDCEYPDGVASVGHFEPRRRAAIEGVLVVPDDDEVTGLVAE
jgi:hypothetical protein